MHSACNAFWRGSSFTRAIFSERSARERNSIPSLIISRFDRFSSVCPLATVAWLEISTLDCVAQDILHLTRVEKKAIEVHVAYRPASRGLSLSPNVNEVSKATTLWKWSIVYLICTDLRTELNKQDSTLSSVRVVIML